ncbi:MAG TPA: globin domain-containing protein [Streptosporangiaceae bacterium]
MASREGQSRAGASLNPALVKESFAHVESAAGKATAYFYGRLFASNPEMRAFFPLAMDRQRHRFFRALARIVWSLDSPDQLTAYLRQLGRDHRRFGVTARHYPEFMESVAATVREFAGPAWSDEVAAAWDAVLALVRETMLEAADADAEHAPSWWLAEVVGHQRRAGDLAVLTVRPDQPLHYLPGQYVSVQSARWPREWRSYSIANAPRRDGTLSLHVRAVPGGLVSNALVHHTVPGDTLLLGPAKGSMTLPAGTSGSGLFCVAGGTGLAPIKALAEQAATAGGPAVALLFGARTRDALYDLRDLRLLADAFPGLELVTAVSDEPLARPPEAPADLPTLVRERRDWADREVYVCGPPAMLRQTQRVLAELGVPPGRVHYDEPDPPDPPDQDGEPPA